MVKCFDRWKRDESVAQRPSYGRQSCSITQPRYQWNDIHEWSFLFVFVTPSRIIDDYATKDLAMVLFRKFPEGVCKRCSYNIKERFYNERKKVKGRKRKGWLNKKKRRLVMYFTETFLHIINPTAFFLWSFSTQLYWLNSERYLVL